jgi:hypothetical protein
MEENFDRFPVNILETSGEIERNPFNFNYDRCEVWQAGSCIYSGNSKSKIEAHVVDDLLQIVIDDESVEEYINQEFTFSEISTNNDRIMWSNDLLDTTDEVEYNTPNVSSLFYKNGILSKVTFTIHDPNTLVEFYLDESISLNSEPDIIAKAKQVIKFYSEEKRTLARPILVDIYHSVKYNPTQLKDVKDFESLGEAFLFMLDQGLSDDIDTLQMMASLAYLFISKALQQNTSNPDLIKDRLLVLRIGHEAISYTVMSILADEGVIYFSMMGNPNLKARDAIYKMEIADLEANPILYLRMEYFSERKNEFDAKIRNEFFSPEKTKESIIETGINMHKKLFNYLENKVLVDGDVDF